MTGCWCPREGRDPKGRGGEVDGVVDFFVPFFCVDCVS